jgi:hypothetical protein
VTQNDGDQEVDPVLTRRARVAWFVRYAQLAGAICFAIATIAFVYGLVQKAYTDAIVAVIQWSLIVGSLLLAPSMVLGYAVKAANRADRDGDWR